MADIADSGIYEIVNLVNGKRYIGSAKFLRKRRGQHWTRLRGGWHNNRHLQNSWNKNGGENFEFRVLLRCRVEDLLFFEQRAIDAFSPALNICPTAGSTLGRRHSSATRAKIGARKVGLKMPPRSVEHCAAISRALSGKMPAPEKMEKLQAGRRAFVRTPRSMSGCIAGASICICAGPSPSRSATRISREDSDDPDRPQTDRRASRECIACHDGQEARTL